MLTRRTFLSGASGALNVLSQSRRPNVLMLAVDDWNDWVGALGGHPQVKTPNLDRLAAQGVLFTDAHTAAPICNPSRTAVMTGMRPSTTGVYGNDEEPWRKTLPEVTTLPQYFRGSGYRAFGGGKVFHHGKGSNDAKSWDEYFFWNPKGRDNGWFDNYSFPPDPEPRRPATPMPTVSWRNFDWASMDVADEDMPDFKVASWASRVLGQRHEHPFFLAAGMFRPHIPWFVPRKYFDLYPLESIVLPPVKEDDLADLPPFARRIALNQHSRHDLLVSTGNWRQAVQAYLACISFSDAMLGRIIDGLQRSPNRDNTIVALWSDHGYHLGEKWHWHKQSLWHRATHVPLVISAPGVTKPGSRCDRPVGLVDLYPTLTELAGLQPPAGLDGVSLRPLLEQTTREWSRPAITTYGRGNHAVRTERWSYIRYHDATEELYDRRQDAHEWINLASNTAMSDVKKGLQRWLPTTEAPGESLPVGVPK
ncbi:MAG TPA: sulfatase [Bryobacteraceae bacterium]|nr:sulfatase [Bryobacteraceae bacterium]